MSLLELVITRYVHGHYILSESKLKVHLVYFDLLRINITLNKLYNKLHASQCFNTRK